MADIIPNKVYNEVLKTLFYYYMKTLRLYNNKTKRHETVYSLSGIKSKPAKQVEIKTVKLLELWIPSNLVNRL